jgi:hypothetical protein
MIDPEDYVIYSSTLREIAMVPIDHFRFRFDIVFTKRTDELRKLGFLIPPKKDDTVDCEINVSITKEYEEHLRKKLRKSWGI